MTLETAKRIVLEQGDQASKEAQAVVRGGMNVCDVLDDGKRKYCWVKVLPTKSDAESSIDAALKLRQSRKKASSKPSPSDKRPAIKFDESPTVSSVMHEDLTPKVEEEPFSIELLIRKAKQKLHDICAKLDEWVVE